MVTRIVDGNNANRLMLLEAEDGGELVTARISAQGVVNLQVGAVTIRPALLGGTGDMPAITGVTAETSMGSLTIPAGAVRPGDRLDFFAVISKTGTGSTQIRARLGGTTLFDGVTLPPSTQTTNLSMALQWILCVGSDLSGPHFVHAVPTSETSNVGIAEVLLDFSAEVPVTFNVTPSVSGDSIRLVNSKVLRIGNPG